MIKQFDLLFFKGTSIWGRIIRGLSKTKYSHVTMILDEFHTLESNWKIRTSIQHFRYPKGSFDIYRYTGELTETQKNKILEFIRNNIDTGYDKLYIITRGLHLLFGAKIYNSKYKYDCDELIRDAFLYAGIDLIEGELLYPESLTYSDLLQLEATL